MQTIQYSVQIVQKVVSFGRNTQHVQQHQKAEKPNKSEINQNQNSCRVFAPRTHVTRQVRSFERVWSLVLHAWYTTPFRVCHVGRATQRSLAKPIVGDHLDVNVSAHHSVSQLIISRKAVGRTQRFHCETNVRVKR